VNTKYCEYEVYLIELLNYAIGFTFLGVFLFAVQATKYLI
jgi:hypothetical protein